MDTMFASPMEHDQALPWRCPMQECNVSYPPNRVVRLSYRSIYDMNDRSGSKSQDTRAISDPYEAEFLEGRRIGFVLRVTLRNLRDTLRKFLGGHGIPWSVWYYLRTLWEEDGLTQRELTFRVGMTQPTTVTALRTLERLGLVILERVDKDRRKMRIRLTRRGRYLERKLLPEIQRLNDEVALKGFSKSERDELKRLLIRMYFNLEQHYSTRGVGKGP